MVTRVRKQTKYEGLPTVNLNARCNGEVVLFKEGHKLTYDVFLEGKVIRFNPSKSGRDDGGIDGAYEVPRSWKRDGRRVVVKIVERLKAQKRAE